MDPGSASASGSASDFGSAFDSGSDAAASCAGASGSAAELSGSAAASCAGASASASGSGFDSLQYLTVRINLSQCNCKWYSRNL